MPFLSGYDGKQYPSLAQKRINPQAVPLPHAFSFPLPSHLTLARAWHMQRDPQAMDNSRPLVILHEVFEDTILDLSWHPSGTALVACSRDGTVAVLALDHSELGTPLGQEEIARLRRETYGSTVGQLAESPLQLAMEGEAGAVAPGNTPKATGETTSPTKTAATPLHPRLAGSPLRPTANGNAFDKVSSRQTETVTKEGRRRITPVGSGGV